MYIIFGVGVQSESLWLPDALNPVAKRASMSQLTRVQHTLAVLGPTGGSLSEVWQLLRQQPAARWSLRVFWVLLFVAVFADFIANDKPLYCRLGGRHYFPVAKHYLIKAGWAEWKAPFTGANFADLPYERVIWPPIPYSPQVLDKKNLNYVSPFGKQRVASWRYRHWLGSDQIGRDVAAGLVWGTRTALWVGLLSMSIALVIGLVLGAVAGFFGDDGLTTTWTHIVLNLFGLIAGLFLAFVPDTNGEWRGWLHLLMTLSGYLILANLIAWAVTRLPVLNKRITLPVDLLVMRLVEILNSIPALLLLLAVAAVLRKPSLAAVMLVIGLIRWTGIARFVRSELLRIRSLSYIEAARVLGLREWRILWRHAVPNALTPVLIALSFGIAGAILLEAFLSFLGIGLAPDEVTWGTMLNVARSNFRAWWLALFPGLAIFVTVTIFNLIGEGLSEAIRGQRQI